jgi:2-keto-4-pentenoate hydratase/2-oxohepta-3-ene-1,7-dioic acid hydratase in catechol pathway
VLSEEFHDSADFPDPHNIDLEFKINGEYRQGDSTSNMHFNIGKQIAYISQYMTLNVGDLVMTGTPEKPAVLTAGDEIEATMSHKEKGVLAKITHKVAAP